MCTNICTYAQSCTARQKVNLNVHHIQTSCTHLVSIAITFAKAFGGRRAHLHLSNVTDMNAQMRIDSQKSRIHLQKRPKHSAKEPYIPAKAMGNMNAQMSRMHLCIHLQKIVIAKKPTKIGIFCKQRRSNGVCLLPVGIPQTVVCCIVLQCVAVCCSVLQCVAVCCSVPMECVYCLLVYHKL